MSDTISRQAAIDAVDSETVSTNPEHFKSSEKFIKFMDDVDIESFGKWQWANGFNTALVAVRLQLKKLPSAQPEPHWIPCSERLPYAEYGESDDVLATCGHRNVEDGIIRWVRTLYFNGGNWCYPTGETYLEKVYAWMPLPEPYKAESEDK